MSLHLFAPSATSTQRYKAVQAALSVLDGAGLTASVAESAFIQLQRETATATPTETIPAMVRAAVVWRKAADAAQKVCAGCVLLSSSTASTVEDVSERATLAAPSPELAQC